MSNTKSKAKSTAVLGMFSAIIVVLQLLSYVVKIGNTFNLSLVLIPIVLGAVLYGPAKGAILGGVFGATVVVSSLTGLDGGGNFLMSISPILTSVSCMVKGILAGLAAGYAAKFFKFKNRYLSVFIAAIVAPIVNTAVFVLCMFLFFKETMTAGADGTNLMYYVIFTMIGVNFLIEFAINVVFAPAVLRVVNAVRRI